MEQNRFEKIIAVRRKRLEKALRTAQMFANDISVLSYEEELRVLSENNLQFCDAKDFGQAVMWRVRYDDICKQIERLENSLI